MEEVVSHKKSHGRLLYLIRWKGFGSDDDTWENASTLDNCPDILKKYTDEVSPWWLLVDRVSLFSAKKRKYHTSIQHKEQCCRVMFSAKRPCYMLLAILVMSRSEMMIISSTDAIPFLNLLTYSAAVPKKIRLKVVSRQENFRSKIN